MANKELTKEKELREYFNEQSKKVATNFKTTLNELKLQGSNSAFYPHERLRSSQRYLDQINPKEVNEWLSSPIQYETKLRELSNMLYNVSGEYKGLIRYFSDMARFYYVIDFVGHKEDHAITKLQKELKKLSSEFTKKNIAHEHAKIMDYMLKEDVFYGYEIEDKNSFFFLRLDPDFCRLSGYSDGMWTFEFDFGYFDGRKDNLETYPEEFKVKYNMYTQDKSNLRWQSLDFNKSVCYKFNETQREIVPPLASSFSGIMELAEYKKMKKVSAKIDNYLILHQKVPVFNDSDKTYRQNNFQIDQDTMMMFHSMLDESLPDEIGAVVSPMDIEPIQLEKSRESSDKVAEATRDIYNSAGVNQYLFNPDKNSTGGLSKSIQKDEMIVIRFYLQIARWMNRKIKLSHSSWKHWVVKLLPVTHMNEKEYSDYLIQLGTLGMPVADAIGAMVGLDAQKMESKLYLLNDVLKLHEKLIPLASSHTGGINNTNTNAESTGEQGRPTVDDDKISDSGQANRDSNEGTTGGQFTT